MIRRYGQSSVRRWLRRGGPVLASRSGSILTSVEVVVYRTRQTRLYFQDASSSPIEDFEIIDNGAGFDQTNFDSFDTADSSLKAELGGKGVGRFVWLKAFESAQIDSVFQDDNGDCQRRRFEFKKTHRGVENVQLDSVDRSQAPRTSVRLTRFSSRYQGECPKGLDVLARRIVEHCLEYFLFGDAPKSLVLREADGGSSHDLNALYSEDFQPKEIRELDINGAVFRVHNIFIRRPNEYKHQVHFCAHRRVVRSESLSNRVPHLDSTLYAENDPHAFVYSPYVSGQLLDKTVEADRTDFRIPADRPSLGFEGPTWKEILNAFVQYSRAFLEPYMADRRKAALEKVKQHLESDAPQYRYLLADRRSEIEDLSPSLSPRKLEVELFKIHQDVRLDLKERTAETLKELDESEPDADSFQEKQIRLIRQLNHVVKSELAEYVVQRRSVLEFLERLLDRQEDGSHAKEAAVHEVVFPLKKTSDELDYEDHNLWLLDEGLVYHKYLASDIPLSTQESPVKAGSSDRPDILIYQGSVALVEGEFPFQSVVLIEFKRPERKDYNEQKSPIQQVLRYASKIRNGEARDRTGATLEVPDNVRFYCYVIASMTPRLKEDADIHGLTPTPDRMGYFGFNEPYKAYIELISFKKLIADAKKRNRIFFDKLDIA